MQKSSWTLEVSAKNGWMFPYKKSGAIVMSMCHDNLITYASGRGWQDVVKYRQCWGHRMRRRGLLRMRTDHAIRTRLLLLWALFAILLVGLVDGSLVYGSLESDTQSFDTANTLEVHTQICRAPLSAAEAATPLPVDGIPSKKYTPHVSGLNHFHVVGNDLVAPCFL